MADRIYMDWAATAPLCAEAAQAMQPYMTPGMGNISVGANANSLHSEGRAAFAALEQARGDIARCIGARPDELIFTSGATEADNMAVYGMVLAAASAKADQGMKDFKPHLVISSIEHGAIYNTVRELKRWGMADVDMVAPDRSGRIDPQAVRAALQPNTVLVSIMLANNEVGTIQPVGEIAGIVHDAGALMHTDAVQAFGKMPVNCKDLDVDAMSLSAHKICGPKGIGALFLRKGTPCEALVLGGGQEAGMRAGTQNVAGAVGFAAACKALCGDVEALEAEAARQRALRDKLALGLTRYEGVQMTVPCGRGSKDFLPNIVNVCVHGFESETLILRFDMQGVALTGGSACSSHSLEPSRVLKAIGVERDVALGSLRFSMGRYTTEEDVDAALKAFDGVINWNAQ